MTSTLTELTPSQFLAAEIRAEMARQGITQRELAKRIGFTQPWVTRRIGLNAVTDLTFEDVVQISKALRISPQGLVEMLLPRLDSNQQPSGYLFPQVTRADLMAVA